MVDSSHATVCSLICKKQAQPPEMCRHWIGSQICKNKARRGRYEFSNRFSQWVVRDKGRIPYIWGEPGHLQHFFKYSCPKYKEIAPLFLPGILFPLKEVGFDRKSFFVKPRCPWDATQKLHQSFKTQFLIDSRMDCGRPDFCPIVCEA